MEEEQEEVVVLLLKKNMQLQKRKKKNKGPGLDNIDVHVREDLSIQLLFVGTTSSSLIHPISSLPACNHQ